MSSDGRGTDDELLQQARGGDMQAFRRLVERYEQAVAGIVVGMLGHGPDAEDVGQETFISFYRALHSFRGESSLKTYLTRIAINQSLKALKRRSTRQKRVVSGDDAMYRKEPAADGNEAADRRERVRLVRRSLDRLKPQHRAVVVLRMIEGYSTRETAAMLGIPQGTVMSRLSRAMGNLESLLKPLIIDQSDR